MSILDRPLVKIVEMIRARDLSPTELTEASLNRIFEVEPQLNAFVTVTADLALKQARIAADEIARGHYRGPLHGIPYAVKDLFNTAGIPTTNSSKVRPGYIPDSDAAAVVALREAGMVLVGKTETHEFAYGALTPQTGNPWDPSRTPGGSSGGSGAAVGSGSVHVALGTDTGGSIRIPAALCGTVGLKPTYGRTSRYGVTPLSWALDHIGPLTRNVADAALVLDALSSFDPRDSSSVSVPAEYRHESTLASALQGSVSGLKVGVPSNFFTENVQDSIARAYGDTLDLLRNLGADLVAVDVPFADAIMPALWAITAAEASAYHLPLMREYADAYTAPVRMLNEAGLLIPAVDYIDALRMRAQMHDAWRNMFSDIDAMIAPTVPCIALPRQEPRITWDDGSVEEGTPAYVRLNAPGNLIGFPVLQVPNAYVDGLPTGVQVICRPFCESVALSVGIAIESNSESVGRTAPVVAES